MIGVYAVSYPRACKPLSRASWNNCILFISGIKNIDFSIQVIIRFAFNKSMNIALWYCYKRRFTNRALVPKSWLFWLFHRRYPEPLIVAKRNAGSGYEIGERFGGIYARTQEPDRFLSNTIRGSRSFLIKSTISPVLNVKTRWVAIDEFVCLIVLSIYIDFCRYSNEISYNHLQAKFWKVIAT